MNERLLFGSDSFTGEYDAIFAKELAEYEASSKQKKDKRGTKKTENASEKENGVEVVEIDNFEGAETPEEAEEKILEGFLR